MVDIGIDRPGHSLRSLVHLALKNVPRDSLFELVKDKDLIVRTIAARFLQTDADIAGKTFNFALALTCSKVVAEREMAAFILGQLMPPNYPFKINSVPVLEELCRDSSPKVRSAAVAGLGHLKSISSKEVVLTALNDKSHDVVCCAAFAMTQIGRPETDSQHLSKIIDLVDKRTREWIKSFLDDWE